MIGSFALAFMAGVVSILSPCVLPLLPVILGTATSESRLGPAALAAGLALSFVTIGLFFAVAGQALNIDQTYVRTFAGVLLALAGLALLVPALSQRLAGALSPAGSWAENRFGGLETGGVKGQLALGLLLGAVWSPCVGPTLGAASVLAAQGKNLAEVAGIMGMFGIGAAVPLLLLGLLSRETMLRWRGRMLGAGQAGKAGLGLLLLLVGTFILTGLDKRLETALVAASPAWLTELTTRF